MKTRTYVQEGKPQFWVNKEKGVVVCKVTATIDPGNLVHNPSLYWAIFDACHKEAKKHHNIYQRWCSKSPFEITSIKRADCGPHDVFDEEKGKHIAQTRCQKEIYLTLSEVFSNVTDYLVKNLISTVDTLSDNLALTGKKACEHLVELCK